MVRRGMPEGSRFGAGDGILKDMGLSSSSPVLQRVRKDGDGMRGTGDVATVYGEGESRGNAARVIWSFGHLAYRPKTEVETSSVARVQSRPTQNRGDTWSRVGIRDLEDTARGPRRDGGRDSGVVGWMELQVAFVDPRDPGRWAKMASPLHHADAQMRPPPGCQAKTPTERRIRLDVRQTGAHLYETRQVSSDVCSLLINHAAAPRLQGWLACPAVLDPLPLGKTARPGQPSAAARNNSRPSTRPRWNCPQTSRRKMPADGSIVDTHPFGVSTVSPSH